MPALFSRISPASIKTSTTAVTTMTNSPPSAYRFDVLHRAEGMDADSCEGQGLGSDRSYSPASYDDWMIAWPDPAAHNEGLPARSLHASTWRYLHRRCQSVPYPYRNGRLRRRRSAAPESERQSTPQDPQDPHNTPSPKAPEPGGPVAIALPEHTNVRLGPGTEYEIVRSVPRGHAPGSSDSAHGMTGTWWRLTAFMAVYGSVRT